ncbi:MAG: tetratricopeptide repeat protein [Kiritimatiellae bacterium]|nr:tetratricopeptide repeat protein [Kiritimatiellia bacterium]
MSIPNRICVRAAATLLCLAGFSAVWADNNDLAKIGEEHMDAGRYAEAIKAFEKITVTYENIITVNFNLAWCYYLTEKYDLAIPKLVDLSGPRTPNEASRLQSMFLLADSYARLAGQEEPGSADRKKNIGKAIDLHSEFISKYPANENIPNAIYSRAYTYYIDDQFDKAETDLKVVIQKVPNKPLAKDAQYLLANVYSRQGMNMMKAGKPEEAKVFMEKARLIFKELAKSDVNLAMANNSVFSLAQTWFNAEMYRGAIRYFREVRPKQDVLQDLDYRLDKLMSQQAADIGSGRGALPLKKDIDKVKAQRAAVAESSDLMISAYLQIAVSYYKLHRYDESRIICRHLIDLARDSSKTEKEQAYYLLVSSYLEEKNPDAAANELAGFQATFGSSSPIAESASLSIGQLFMMQGDVAKAVEQFNQSTEQYPNAKDAEEAFYLRFSAEYLLNQASNTAVAVQAYLDKFPKGRYVPNALYLKGMSLAALSKWDDAVSTLDEIIAKFPKKTDTFQAQDEVLYQKGFILWQKAESLDPNNAPANLPAPEREKARLKIIADKKTATRDAVKELEAFTQRGKTSAARPAGLYYLGLALNAAGEFDKAQATLYAIHKEYPANSIAPAALYQIGAMYYARTNLTQMAKVLDELVEAYPNNPINVDAYFFLGYIANKEARYDDAVGYLYASIETAPDNPRAPECLSQTAQAHLDKAKAMGAPAILSDAQKSVYRQALLDSANSYEDILLNYPDTDQAMKAIPGIAETIGMLVRYQLLTEEAAATYYSKAMARRPEDTNLKARLLFSMGRYLLKNDQKEKALKMFNEALTANPDVVLSAEMLTDYADALKDAKDLDKAEAIYTKIIKNYPDDPRAPAPAWFGLAEIKFQQGKFTKEQPEAQQYYEKVLKEYPWYEPGKQAKVRLAMIYEKQGLFEQAEKMYEAVWKDEMGEAKLGAMLGVARCQLARAKELKQSGRMQEYADLLKVTDLNLTKLIVLYETFDKYVAEALWLKGQAYELAGDQAKARETYDRLVKQYNKSPWAKPGIERLQQMPAPAAGGKP